MMTQHAYVRRLKEFDPVRRTGRVRAITATCIEADGPPAPLGSLCRIAPGGRFGQDEPNAGMLAEIVGVREDCVVLAPLGPIRAIAPGAEVFAISHARTAQVGDGFLGRAIDALANPIDGGAPIALTETWPLDGTPPSPLERTTPKQVFETGIKAIDGLFTLGVGQRIGIFSAAGVGKSTFLSQIALQSTCDCSVICLVGERGREIEALWSRVQQSEKSQATALVAAASDQSAALRARAIDQALALAEHWRAQGRHVLLVLDSVTRLAMALREIGLAAGEPATVRAYPPSAFAALPRLVERCGATKSGGAITAIMSILAESDDVEDPISETMRSLLDGHILLSRHLSEQGHFPAIDAPRSLSRLAAELMDAKHRSAAQRVCKLISTYDSSRTLIDAGVYARGANSDIDHAIDRRADLMTFLAQKESVRVDFQQTKAALMAVAGGVSS